MGRTLDMGIIKNWSKSHKVYVSLDVNTTDRTLVVYMKDQSKPSGNSISKRLPLDDVALACINEVAMIIILDQVRDELIGG